MPWTNPATQPWASNYTVQANDLVLHLKDNLSYLGGADGDSKTGRLRLGTTSSANNTTGLTINGAGADDEYVTLRDDTDVAHGMTTLAETGCFGHLFKSSNAGGGLGIRGLDDGGGSAHSALYLEAVLGQVASTTHTAAGFGVARVDARVKSGTGSTSVAADGNLFTIGNNGQTQWICDADGDMFNNGASGTSTTYDGEDDGALVEAVATLMNPGRARNYRFSLARDLAAHTAALAAGGVITLNPDGSLAMLSYKGMLGLLIDAIRQVTHAHRTLAARVAPLLPEGLEGAVVPVVPAGRGGSDAHD